MILIVLPSRPSHAPSELPSIYPFICCIHQASVCIGHWPEICWIFLFPSPQIGTSSYIRSLHLHCFTLTFSAFFFACFTFFSSSSLPLKDIYVMQLLSRYPLRACYPSITPFQLMVPFDTSKLIPFVRLLLSPSFILLIPYLRLSREPGVNLEKTRFSFPACVFFIVFFSRLHICTFSGFIVHI